MEELVIDNTVIINTIIHTVNFSGPSIYKIGSYKGCFAVFGCSPLCEILSLLNFLSSINNDVFFRQFFLFFCGNFFRFCRYFLFRLFGDFLFHF